MLLNEFLKEHQKLEEQRQYFDQGWHYSKSKSKRLPQQCTS